MNSRRPAKHFPIPCLQSDRPSTELEASDDCGHLHQEKYRPNRRRRGCEKCQTARRARARVRGGAGWTVADAYVFTDDGFSGANFDRRPGLKALEALLADRRPPFQALIVSELSRLGREQYATGGILKALRRAGVSLHTSSDARSSCAPPPRRRT
jgi:DNA invertase Pin-like site-specific DNA recombinase